MKEEPDVIALEKPADTGIGTGGDARVILFNDDWHTFQDVIIQLMRAIHCTPKKGEELANKVHFDGQAEVYKGNVEECLQVSAVLEEIKLKTEVQFS